MNKEVEQFINQKRAVNSSENTILAYKQQLTLFFTTIKKETKDITKDDIQKFINKRLKADISAYTVRQNIVSLKVFYKYMQFSLERFDGIMFPKMNKTLPRMLTRAEVDSIIKVCKNKKYAFLIELLVKTGLRISEALSLTKDNFSNNNRVIKVLGKGGKERLIPIPANLLLSVNEYLHQIHTNYLFPSNTGDLPMKRMFVDAKLNQLAKKAGLENKKVSAHIFRHTYASQLIEVGGDIREVQELLGHSSIITTQRYTHCSGEQLNKLVNKL